MAEEVTPAVEEVVEVPAMEEATPEPEAVVEVVEETLEVPAAEVAEETPAASKTTSKKKIPTSGSSAAEVVETTPVVVQEYTLPSVTHGVAGSTHIAVSHRNR